jgi:EmrB/QacA subfamily drug resistance transporter
MASTTSPVTASRRANHGLALVSFASAVGSLDLSLMFVAYPSIKQHFDGESISLVSWVLTSYSIVAGALLIPAGRIADRVGRRKIFVLSITLFTIGSALCAVAPNVPWLISARVIAAVGGAMLTPSALAIIMTTFPLERRAWAIGVWSTVSGAIATMGPTIGALLITYASWRWTFLINVPIGIVCAVLGPRLLDESKVPNAGPLPDPFGVVLIMGGIAMTSFAIVQSNVWGWTAQGTLLSFAVAASALALFLHRCRTQPTPVLDLRIFKPFLFRATTVAAIAAGVTFWGGYYLFVQFLTLGWGFEIMQAGLLLIPMTLTASFVGVPAGKLMDRYGNRVVMVPAALSFTLAMLYLGWRLGAERAVVAVWLPAAIGVGITNAVYFPGVNSAGARAAPPEALGTTAGVVQTLIRLGGALGTALGIALVGDFRQGDAAGNLRPAFFVLAGVGVIAALAAAPLATRRFQPTPLGGAKGNDADRNDATGSGAGPAPHTPPADTLPLS